MRSEMKKDRRIVVFMEEKKVGAERHFLVWSNGNERRLKIWTQEKWTHQKPFQLEHHKNDGVISFNTNNKWLHQPSHDLFPISFGNTPTNEWHRLLIPVLLLLVPHHYVKNILMELSKLIRYNDDEYHHSLLTRTQALFREGVMWRNLVKTRMVDFSTFYSYFVYDISDNRFQTIMLYK